MKEYIERETVVAFLENMAASRFLIQSFQSKEKFPAADVEPVQHGEWIYDHWCEFKCSNCGHWSNTLPRGKEKYCPNCGARMAGGNSNG